MKAQLTSHVNFVVVESTDVAFVNSTTSPDNKLALASLKSKFEFVSSCVLKEKETIIIVLCIATIKI
jgi:hypothetical protein